MVSMDTNIVICVSAGAACYLLGGLVLPVAQAQPAPAQKPRPDMP